MDPPVQDGGRGAVSEPRRLCRLEEVSEGDARGFALDDGTGVRKVLVVRRGGRVFGYLNRCPHAGTPLDWVPGRFFCRSREYLMCAMHGALFEIETGLCIDGPCAGDRLAPVALRIEGGAVVLAG